jgi:signal transduction histidine kinase
MRTLLLELHPAALIEKDLGDLLQQLAEASSARTRIPVNVTIYGKMTFPEQVQIALCRIAQESLNNVLKHAGATTVQLHLDCRGQQTVLRVSDDGCGFDLDDHTAGTLPISKEDSSPYDLMTARSKSRLGNSRMSIGVTNVRKSTNHFVG